ncbi:hypothetical protein, partial [Klebsiella pneumoniae]|uniref:hypothetical protein n=1 Tax=Klebsiella pneumoniae TaxID=573 RepID=UPI000E353C6F
LKMPAFEWVHVQLHQQKGMISLSPPTICNSAHDNKSQRADPFVVLSRIIAGKTKCVKDRFSAQILHEASNDAG